MGRNAHTGLIDSSNTPRSNDPWTFVGDLWLDNPAILDRLNLSRENLPKPSQVRELSDVLDVLQ